MMMDLLYASYANKETEKQRIKQTLIFIDTAIVAITLVKDSRQIWSLFRARNTI